MFGTFDRGLIQTSSELNRFNLFKITQPIYSYFSLIFRDSIITANFLNAKVCNTTFAFTERRLITPSRSKMVARVLQISLFVGLSTFASCFTLNRSNSQMSSSLSNFPFPSISLVYVLSSSSTIGFELGSSLTFSFSHSCIALASTVLFPFHLHNLWPPSNILFFAFLYKEKVPSRLFEPETKSSNVKKL